MREIRQSGSEGGGGREASPYLYLISCRLRRLGRALASRLAVASPPHTLSPLRGARGNWAPKFPFARHQRGEGA